jgi:hypothetical protein
MSFAEFISLAKDVATLLALLIGAAISLFIFFQFAPVLELRILPTWADTSKQFLVVKFEVENKSRVRANKPRGQIQILEYPFNPGQALSQWVPFEKSTIPNDEQPVEWREPEKIFKSTRRIYPGEVISLERLYHYPQGTVIIHIGLQVQLEMGFVGRILTRQGGGERWRQTVTRFVVKQIEARDA